MLYQKIKPSEKLQPFVKWYFVLEHDKWLDVPFEIKSSANCSMAMIFNYGSRYQLYNKKYSGEFLPKIFISGISTTPYSLKYPGQLSMFGIIFNATSYQDIFNLPPLHEWVDERLDATNILNNEVLNINDQLANAADNNSRTQIIERWLWKKIQKNEVEKSIIDTAVEILFEQKGMVRLDELAEHIGYSPRQLRRKFKERAGIGPKTYARLKRFNYVNHCLAKNPNLSWFSFIDDNAFYDQSHLIKDYKEFSGEIPTYFLDKRRKIQEKLIKDSISE